MRPAFLDRFEHVTGPDEQWRATCPGCGGRRSLSIGAGRDRWLVRCFAGCRPKAVLEHARLRFDDLLFEAERGGEHTSTAHERGPLFVVLRSTEREEPEVEQLLGMADRGELVPLPVVLPGPANATPAEERVAAFYVRVRGVRLWAGDDRDVLFTCGWVAGKVGLPKTTVWRALAGLEACGALVCSGALADGARLYAPGATNVVRLPRRAAS